MNGPDRFIHRFRRAHGQANRPAENSETLLRKARAVFLLRARQASSEFNWPLPNPTKAHFIAMAEREVAAARSMHRLLMMSRAEADNESQTKEMT